LARFILLMWWSWLDYYSVVWLADVVSAYKELQQEKIALEESLRALSSVRSSEEHSPRSINKNENGELAANDRATNASPSNSSTELTDVKV